MNSLISAAFGRARVVALLLISILTIGAVGYVAIPKESSPEVAIPIIYVVTTLEGISPEDSERLLVEPLETELSSIEGLKEMTGSAAEGYASVTLEFDPGFESEEAMSKVREAVDRAKTDLPEDATEPSVNEVNTSLFPILTTILSGPVPERTLIRIAEDLQDDMEALEGVLEVDIGGTREELLEVLIDPTVFETYNLTFEELIGQISRNNRLIAAGAIDTGAGRLVLKVPGLIEDLDDVLNMPVKVRGTTVVTFADIATVRRTYRDPDSFARIDGQPALALEIKKRVGANIIETVAQVKDVIEQSSRDWPDTVRIEYMQDESAQVEDMLGDLENNVIAAVVLVMIVIVFALGIRTSILVGLSIPGAFLAGVAVLWMMGYTMNIVVLFSLILVVGMLVDGAIVTTELADRRLLAGDTPRQAYSHAAKRMAWPIIASTATTLSVFFPLLFWDGIVGEFMKFLPITVIVTLGASLLMALIFIPVLGGLIGKAQPQSPRQRAQLAAAETGDPRDMKGLAGGYVAALEWAILRPGRTLIFALIALVASFVAYGQFGTGVSFFPSVEPDFAQVQVRSRDNFSIYERDELVRQVEDRLLGFDEIQSVYARSTLGGGQTDEDVIGTIQLEFTEWDTRRTAEQIGEDIRDAVADIAGIDVQYAVQQAGPGAGKPIALDVISRNAADQQAAVVMIREAMDRVGGFTDVTDDRPLPGVEWQLDVNRAEAARFGADITLLGQAVQLLTNGIEVAEYRPDDAEGEVDIRVRFPANERTLEELESLRIPTAAGLIPIGNFVDFVPAPRSGTIHRSDQRRVITIEADVAPGLLPNDQVIELQAAIDQLDLPPSVEATFGGEAQDQADAAAFLITAFFAALAAMVVILVTQFNSLYQALVVMSAIVFSVAGVLLGLIITGRPFGVVMGGIGVIALAGIVVNNNIVLIDTYNDLRKEGQSAREALLRTGAQRLRPVVLTSLTTALGLMPMVIGVNIDFFNRSIVFGAPSTQWWTELSSAIAGGLVFATVLTLIVTPAMLMLGVRLGEWRARRRTQRQSGHAVPAE
ncbi:efflux RND transporter permease subunit [Pontivivens nitratireducens]|uniref:Efflux RND transporter permease subunit n=1 Tax=Pontivivens nitratireducens TaxID=2758038 RepID=A0A6G7VJ18_9RHOB|nr:efflux RND transporter permease subunit [Pontibrevibacter nitratireducens]QIK39838.1 efflux RND transporter permease subunit [Pontibrevibacter nitratireducens]